jgi:hypothetical protein
MVFTVIMTLSIMSQVAATSDLMLAYMDFFLGGDEKRSDLPPRLHQRFPMSIILGEMEVTQVLSLFIVIIFLPAS